MKACRSAMHSTLSSMERLPCHEYHLGDVILQRVQVEKDLGVTISSNLSWDLHDTRIVLN